MRVTPNVLWNALIILLITFVLGEVTFRLYNYFHPSPIFFSKSYNRFRPPPFSDDYDFKLNSKGFKDVEHPVQKPPGEFRILGIGDSFAFGVVPYQHNYYTLLEQKLKRNGKRVEIVNMGIPGTGPIDYLSLFVNEGMALNPDMVLVSFFIGNDFEEQQDHVRSYVFDVIKYVIDINTKLAGPVVHSRAIYNDNAPAFTDDAYLNIEKGRSMIFIKGDRKFPKWFQAAVGHVIKMKEICAQRGIAFSVVLIPDELQVDPLLQQKVLDQRNASSGTFDFELPNRLLQAKLKEHNIDYIDLLDTFRSKTKENRLYRVNDSHWNIAGNELASTLILQHLMPQLP